MKAAVEQILARLRDQNVEVSADEVESRMRLLVEKFGVPEGEATRSVINYFLDEKVDGISTGAYWLYSTSRLINHEPVLGLTGQLAMMEDQPSSTSCLIGREPVLGLTGQLSMMEDQLSSISCLFGHEPVQGLVEQIALMDDQPSSISRLIGREPVLGLTGQLALMEEGLSASMKPCNPDLELITPQLSTLTDFYPEVYIELLIKNIRDVIREVVCETVREVVREELKRMKTSDESDL